MLFIDLALCEIEKIVSSITLKIDFIHFFSIELVHDAIKTKISLKIFLSVVKFCVQMNKKVKRHLRSRQLVIDSNIKISNLSKKPIFL